AAPAPRKGAFAPLPGRGSAGQVASGDWPLSVQPLGACGVLASSSYGGPFLCPHQRRRAAEEPDEIPALIKKQGRHDAVAIDFNSTEKPSSARRLMRRRACVSGRRRSKWVGPRSL